jgi:hypothetical protein
MSQTDVSFQVRTSAHNITRPRHVDESLHLRR